jgi:hypothetical protein
MDTAALSVIQYRGSHHPSAQHAQRQILAVADISITSRPAHSRVAIHRGAAPICDRKDASLPLGRAS